MRASIPSGLTSLLFATMVIAFFTASGCTSDSYHYGSDLAQLGQFPIEKNKTTQDEMLAHFGRPGEFTSSGSTGSLTTMMAWTDVRSQEDSRDTLIAGDSHSRVRITTTLRATCVNGIVTDYTTSSSTQAIKQESSGILGL